MLSSLIEIREKLMQLGHQLQREAIELEKMAKEYDAQMLAKYPPRPDAKVAGVLSV